MIARTLGASLVTLLVFSAGLARAGDSAASTWNMTNTDGEIDSGWVVGFPTGSSDFFNVRFDGLLGRPVRGVSVASADFGSPLAYPLAGIAEANLALDPTGNTPDLATVIGNPLAPGGAVYNWIYSSLGVTYRPATEPQHVVVQLPPGDSGLLGVGQDDDPPKGSFSGWTQDGYKTRAHPMDGDMGLNANIDIDDELPGPGGALGLLVDADDETGDLTTATVGTTQDIGVAFFAAYAGSVFTLFESTAGVPTAKIGPEIDTWPDGAHGYRRVAWTIPAGSNGVTLELVAVSGVPGVQGSVGISNQVDLKIVGGSPGWRWGVWDDCSFESGWVVSIPAGSSDYFNVNFNNGPGAKPNEITGIALAVVDFGSSATAFPVSGAFPANYTVDPSGNTPDLTLPYDAAPFPLPPIDSTSSCGMPLREFKPAIPYSSVISDDVHGVVQFPPGDGGLLAIGGDTTPPISGKSGWTIDGYATPANMVNFANMGIRLTSR